MQNNVLGKIGVGIVFVSAVSALIFIEKPRRVVYDCSLSEISPDYPLEVKEACRRLRAKHSIHT